MGAPGASVQPSTDGPLPNVQVVLATCEPGRP